jgi:hypothetical protein
VCASLLLARGHRAEGMEIRVSAGGVLLDRRCCRCVCGSKPTAAAAVAPGPVTVAMGSQEVCQRRGKPFQMPSILYTRAFLSNASSEQKLLKHSYTCNIRFIICNKTIYMQAFFSFSKSFLRSHLMCLMPNVLRAHVTHI